MRVLLISIAFPPKRDPESLQVAKYCKYIQLEKEIQLEVVTSKDPTLFMETDHSLKRYAIGINVGLRIRIYENRYVNRLIRIINSNLLRYPDSKFTFWWQRFKVVKAIQKPDLIYSRSYPISSTLVALELKKKWNIPWVLHLSDPWVISSDSSRSPATLTGNAKKWNKRKEQECFESASIICLTSHKTIELYANEYPHLREKFVYMPNVFDDSVVKINPIKKSKKLKFLYTGGFAEFRSPLTLLEAIKAFWQRGGASMEDQVEFLFTGEMARVNARLFSQYDHITIIKHLGVLPYDEVLILQRDAHILINVDTDIHDPSQAVYFPSKLLDYIIAQRRIVAITNTYSTTYDVVQHKLGICFGFNEILQLADYFAFALDKFVKNDSDYFFIQKIDEEFSAKRNVDRLHSIFKSLLGKYV